MLLLRAERLRAGRPDFTQPALATVRPQPQSAASVRGLVADDPGRQHDVTGPAAGPAEADEHAIPPGPVLANQPLPAVGQRQGRGAPRAVPARVAPVPFGIQGKPAPP